MFDKNKFDLILRGIKINEKKTPYLLSFNLPRRLQSRLITRGCDRVGYSLVVIDFFEPVFAEAVVRPELFDVIVPAWRLGLINFHRIALLCD
jgi:hypothetical protein